MRRAFAGSNFSRRAAAIAVLCSIAISFTMIDAAFDEHLVLLLAGVLGVHLWVQNAPKSVAKTPRSTVGVRPAQQAG